MMIMHNERNMSGMSLIELLVAIFVLAILGVAIGTLAALGIRTAVVNEQRVVAQALANEQLEQLYSMPYENVSNATIVRDKDVSRNEGQTYRVTTIITDVNDDVDGDMAPGDVDYKQVEVRVQLPSGDENNEIVMTSLVMPKGSGTVTPPPPPGGVNITCTPLSPVAQVVRVGQPVHFATTTGLNYKWWRGDGSGTGDAFLGTGIEIDTVFNNIGNYWVGVISAPPCSPCYTISRSCADVTVVP